MRVARILGVVLGVAAAAALLAFGYVRNHAEAEKEHEEAIKAPDRVERDDEGEPVLHLDAATVERIGLATATLTAITLAPSVVAYGRIEADPARVYVVRAPFAGVVRAAEGGGWPALGEVVAADADLGAIAPRLQALERVDVATRIASARADEASAEASLTAARAALDRARRLNAEEKNISDRALQEAEVRVRSEEARLEAARASARLLASALDSTTTTAVPLRAGRGGEIVEVAAAPGEAVESGQMLFRLARFDRVLARVELPVGVHVDGRPAGARVAVVGREDAPFAADAVGRAGAVDATAQAETFLLGLAPGEGISVRPGAAVTAWIELPGEPRAGVVIPRDAVVRYAGKAWAYVAIGAEAYSRHEVATDQPVADGWFVAAGFAPGDRVVGAGAGTLLSEELKPTIEAGD